jgi:sensor histidine kinase regulating citrate/malate metabolism
MLPIFAKSPCCLGVVVVGFSQHGVGKALILILRPTLLAGCLLLRLSWQSMVSSSLGVAVLAF